MSGALCLHRGTLWVGWHAKTAHVMPFDLGGRALARGFHFSDPRIGRATVRGLGLDDDRNLWIADEASSRVRRFSVFGRELGGLGLSLQEELAPYPQAEAQADAPAQVRRPTAVIAHGDSDGLELLVGSGGTRRHALQLFTGAGALISTLRPMGEPHGRFQGLRGLARRGRFIAVAEREADRIQIFRDLDFHFAFRPAHPGFGPTAIALLHDGRMLISGSSGVILCSPSGRLEKHLIPSHTFDPAHPEETVEEPLSLAIQESGSPRHSRLAILDRLATRVQIYNLEGRHYGSFSPP